jgi:hypothetical protein
MRLIPGIFSFEKVFALFLKIDSLDVAAFEQWFPEVFEPSS